MISDVYTIIWSESVKFYSSDPTNPPCPKRKSGVEVERCPKKSKPQENKSALQERRHDVLSHEIVLGLKRRLRMTDKFSNYYVVIRNYPYKSGRMRLRCVTTDKFVTLACSCNG